MKFKIYLSLLVVFLTMSSANAEYVWKDMNIQLQDGGKAWATVRYQSSCYNLLLGGDGVRGTGANCGTSTDGNWSITACGDSVMVYGGIDKAVRKILKICS